MAPTRSRLRGALVLAIAVVAPLLSAPAAQAQTTSATAQSQSVFVVRVGAESDLDALTKAASTDTTYGQAARGLLSDWRKTVSGGKTITGAVGMTSTSAIGQLVAIDAASQRAEKALAAARAAGTAQAAPEPSATVNVDGHSPNSFRIDGSIGSGRTYWYNMRLIVAAHFCNASSCSADTDRISTRLRIDPNGYESTFSSTTVYSPNAGNFGNKHLHLWSITPGGVGSGDGDTQDISTSHIDYLRNNPRTNGKYMTLAVTLWVYVKPWAYYQADGAKTNDAQCKARPSNACYY